MRGDDFGKNKEMHIEDILRLSVCSDLRRNLLISLNEGKRPLRILRYELGITSTTAIHALRELEKSYLVFQDKDRNYTLTNIGRITALKLQEFLNAAEVLKKHERYWLEHDLSGIPEHLLEKIGWLKDSVLVTNTEIDIFKVHSNFINLLRNAKEIRGVSPFFIPEFPLLLRELIIERNLDIQLLLTTEVHKKIGKEILEELLEKKNSKFELYISEKNVKLAFTVTDYFLSIGFFHIDGTYDFSSDLISHNKKAIVWGRELFEHYIEMSEKVVL